MELAAQIQELSMNLAKLPESKLGFASSLISQYMRKRTLSDKQIPYVAQLLSIAKGEIKTPERTRTDVGSFLGVIALFKAAGAKLKRPKIRLQIGEESLVLSVAGEQSKAPGCINVVSGGSWGDRLWYGRVSPDGMFERSRQLTEEFAAVLIPLLQELANDPLSSVQRYGKLTGSCMFCGLQLSDQRSKAAGFGQTCAENWGLEEQWRNAVRQGPVPVTAAA